MDKMSSLWPLSWKEKWRQLMRSGGRVLGGGWGEVVAWLKQTSGTLEFPRRSLLIKWQKVIQASSDIMKKYNFGKKNNIQCIYLGNHKCFRRQKHFCKLPTDMDSILAIITLKIVWEQMLVLSQKRDCWKYVQVPVIMSLLYQVIFPVSIWILDMMIVFVIVLIKQE